MPQPFKKVLIANRGEIACRITQTLQEMGILAVAVYSDVDADAVHVRVADEAYPLGGKTPGESYLNQQTLIDIAKANDIQAIHPGYGFLSENAGFAAACKKAGLVFIGPEPDVIEAMGDKIISKETMAKAGVPVVPSWTGDPADTAAVKKQASALGYPILVKAAAGGGGKGMRLVHDESQLTDAIEGAQREALKAFGDARVFLEKYITNPRHIEFQVFGDTHGNVVHGFERECSIQRRHQKVIEESPSVFLTPALREAMASAAVNAAKAVNYTNAGTVEFIVSDHGEFYFLEMNTRLQVEHPVTELVIHRDLVRAQVLVAMGEPLPFTQADLHQSGHAIECRVYAEDPLHQFLPSTGKLHLYQEPNGPGIRVDSGVTQGSDVTVYYDPMLAKLVCWAATRNEAIEKMQWALAHYPVLGVLTNIDFLQGVMAHPDFKAANVTTHFLESHPIEAFLPTLHPEGLSTEAVLGAWVQTKGHALMSQRGSSHASSSNSTEPDSPWLSIGAWSNVR